MKKTKNIEVVLQVKGNQPKLFETCITLSKTRKPYGTHIQKGKRERGRIEKRVATVYHKGAYDLGDVWNDHVKTIIKIQRNCKKFNTKTKQFENTKETAYYLSTAQKLSAKTLALIIRSHWGIEANHYVRDVTLREDFSRIRKNPENIATLRSFSLNIMRMNGEGNISQAIYRNALNITRILGYIGVGR